MFGAWNSAVPNPGTILQLRALDWSVDGMYIYNPCTKYAGNTSKSISILTGPATPEISSTLD